MGNTTISSLVGGNLWPSNWGASGTLGIYCDNDFVSDDGKSWQGGDGQTLNGEFITKAAITVSSNIPTYSSYTLPQTDYARPNTVHYYGVIFDANGQPRDFLFDDFHLRSSLGSSISFQQWQLDNAVPIKPQPDGAPTTSAMNTAITTAVTNAALNQDYVISSYSSFSAAIDAMPASGATLVINTATGVTANKTVPGYVTLKFTGKGSLTISNGVTVTIAGAIEASPTQIFSGTGTVSLSGNTSLSRLYWQWFGGAGNNSTDDTAAMQKTLNAAGGLPILTTSNFTPKITDTLTSTGRVTIIGEGLTGNGSAPEPSFNWYGAADGVMFSFTGTEYLWLEGFSVALKAGANSAATAFKWNTTGPASKIVFNNLFVENRAVNPNTKLFYSSPTSTQNNEDVSFFSVKMLASNDDSPTGASRGYCYYQGANPNAIDITFDHCWFLDASVALSFHGGNNIAIRDSFIMESNTGIETATDVTVENVRFENVGQYAKSLGGTANWVFRKNSFNNARLTPANAAFDFSAGSVALTITDSIPLDASDPAQIWFSTTGGSSLFSENNGYPTTSALNADSFSNYWSFNDSGFSAGKLVRKLGSGVEQVIDVGTGLDGLMKFSIDGASPAIKQRVGPSSNAGTPL
jgi:hypothetical protein